MTELPSPNAESLRVLVFEDSAMDAALIKKFLKTAGVDGAHIFHADTIPSALQVLSRTPIDVCLADYHLHPHTGIDLMEEVRRSHMDVPFIVVTAIDDRCVDEEALSHGAYDFLVKGDLTVEGLDRSIRYAVASHRRERSLSRTAYFDPLTGLPNRVSFLERLTQAVADNRSTGGLVGVALLNLDRTKAINTRFGHEVGDEILMAAAERLDNARQPSDFLARIGGDEFALLMNGILLQSHALSTTQSLIDALTGPVDTSSGPHVITATSGLAVREIRAEDATVETARQLMLKSTQAMFDAKMAGRRRGTSNMALARAH